MGVSIPFSRQPYIYLPSEPAKGDWLAWPPGRQPGLHETAALSLSPSLSLSLPLSHTHTHAHAHTHTLSLYLSLSPPPLTHTIKNVKRFGREFDKAAHEGEDGDFWKHPDYKSVPHPRSGFRVTLCAPRDA